MSKPKELDTLFLETKKSLKSMIEKLEKETFSQGRNRVCLKADSK